MSAAAPAAGHGEGVPRDSPHWTHTYDKWDGWQVSFGNDCTFVNPSALSTQPTRRPSRRADGHGQRASKAREKEKEREKGRESERERVQ